ncbi:MAG: Sapep family Mn(2+)-dependent dipeptidase [Coriobacteriia bacterium]|nr:Sapep family Mn(2+)-dependent dipeptidase [Coriobacteriia bacterium]
MFHTFNTDENHIDQWIDQHWDQVLTAISDLVAIPSTEDPATADASTNAPFGAGPRAALTAALELAESLGLQTTDVDGYLGFADLPGSGSKQLGIIGHVDVVPAGPGWTVEPFAVTRRDGYLLGRGVIDDKGPILCALFAVRYWQEQLAATGQQFPHTVRVLFGANEETGMADVAHYRARYADPDFLFTPDAEFPVCYGEKGLYGGTLTSAPLADGRLVQLQGGAATNAVPGVATATVRNATAADLPTAPHITLEQQGEYVVVTAQGKSAHASLPEQGRSAIHLLADYLLEADLCSPAEAAFLILVRTLASTWDGSSLGLACQDPDFGKLTIVGGTIELKDGRISQTLDARLPTTADPAAITRKLTQAAAEAGGAFALTRDIPPFKVDPTGPEVAALIDVYNQVSGESAEPFTMGGATYAREFSRGVSFGPEKPWEPQPDWVGGMHGPDEGVSEPLLKQALKIYIYAIARLQSLPL